MRQLLGKLPGKERGAIDEVYLAEQVRCRECLKTSPMGIEVVTGPEGRDNRQKNTETSFFCRAHGAEYQSRAQGDP